MDEFHAATCADRTVDQYDDPDVAADASEVRAGLYPGAHFSAEGGASGLFTGPRFVQGFLGEQ